jgi:hypothetical protein
MNKWRIRVSRRQVLAHVSMLLSVAALLTSVGVLPSTTVQAQTKRLSMFVNFGDQIFYRSSDDGGFNWGGWQGLGCVCQNFDGTPAVVSDRPGHLMAVGRTRSNEVGYYQFFSNSGWTSWTLLRGRDSFTIGGRRYTMSSDPAVSSWGSGRFDIFIYATRDDGAITLLHTWFNNNSWVGGWETLGTGLMQGKPSAVSWGANRIDVFARGGGNEAIQKSWNGSNWSGWTNLGGFITSDIAAASAAPGHVEIWAQQNDQLWHKWGNATTWTDWMFLAGGHASWTSPTAASRGVGNMDVFAYTPNVGVANHWAYNAAPFTLGFVFGLENRTFMNAVYWVP